MATPATKWKKHDVSKSIQGCVTRVISNGSKGILSFGGDRARDVLTRRLGRRVDWKVKSKKGKWTFYEPIEKKSEKLESNA